MKLFREYLIDPAVAQNWRDLRYLLEQCGAEHGRLVAKLPGSWQKRVYRSLGHGRDRERVVELLRRNKGCLVALNREVLHDQQASWLERAGESHRARALDAIIVTDQQEGAGIPLSHPDDLDSGNPRWKTEHCLEVPRQPREMAQAIGLLLEKSTHLKLIDPHLDPGSERYCRVIVEMIEQAQRGNGLNVCQLHSKKDLEPSYLRDKLQDKILARLSTPLSCSLELFLWDERIGSKLEFHDRFVLTNVGGCGFWRGLDADLGGNTHVNVTLLSLKAYQDQLSYFKDTGFYELREHLVIPS